MPASRYEPSVWWVSAKFTPAASTVISVCAGPAAAEVPQIVAIDGEEIMEGPISARFLTDIGAGQLLRHEECSVDDIRKMVTSLVEEPSFRRGAQSLRREIHAVPSPHDVVPVLERMTTHHRRPDTTE
ncbi:nucleotide disphospho-sugar-binding domain-containing protein [Streptomyces sp. NPDC058812]|uniref:nucleotide disphospho-sugar-binding domain-containing protein n=1 Tax=unclassified Streptomyces TaxID=2593676 RepID=UPI0036907F44